MATSKSLSRASQRRSVAAHLSSTSDRRLIVALLKELHHIVLDTGEQFGASAQERRRALRLAGKDDKRVRPSQATLKRDYAFECILGKWRQDPRFLSPDGTPRVLALSGRGVTFAALAREFLPRMRVLDVANVICQNSEVTRLKGNKLALVGSAVMFTPKTAESQLAALVLRFRRLAETIVYNATIPTDIKVTGRFERLVTGQLSEKEFVAFSRSVRQQLQGLCDHIDAGFRPPRGGKTGSARKTSGIGLYVFRDDGHIG